MGIALTVKRVVFMGVLCGVALSVKLSTAMFGPLLALALIVRALWPMRWSIAGRPRALRRDKVYAAVVATLTVACLSYGTLWATYGFRFSATNNPNVRLNVDAFYDELKIKEAARDPGAPFHPPLSVRVAQWGIDHHAFPEAWGAGMIKTASLTLGMPAFLDGEVRTTGSWDYFPIATLVKTPLSALAAGFLAIAVLVVRGRQKRGPNPQTLDDAEGFERQWAVFSFVLFGASYSAVLVASAINMGFRYALPIFPLLFIGIGVVGAELWKTHRNITMTVGLILFAGLSFETVHAWPDYIAYFNAAVGGERGGLAWLGDSNLDWGQDLPLLAKWQRAHRDRRLYLSYFGREDPAFRGIDYINVRPGFDDGPPLTDVTALEAPGVLAVSATYLQGSCYMDDASREFFSRMRDRRPIEVLGGSIYLFDVP
jgi:hypothetical protein